MTATIVCSPASCPSRADADPSPRTAAPAAALAHQSTVSFSELTVRGREVGGVLRFSLADCGRRIRLEDPRHPPLPALIPPRTGFIRAQGIGKACALQAGATAEPDGEDGLALLARWVCPGAVEELSVRVGFLESFPPGHTHFSRIDFGPNELSQRAAQSDAPSFEAGRTRNRHGAASAGSSFSVSSTSSPDTTTWRS